jgi:hypothetical protein
MRRGILMNLHQGLDTENRSWETTPGGETPFSHLENLQNRAAQTAEQLENLIGMECSMEWAEDVRRLADTLQSRLNEMLEAVQISRNHA